MPFSSRLENRCSSANTGCSDLDLACLEPVPSEGTIRFVDVLTYVFEGFIYIYIYVKKETGCDRRTGVTFKREAVAYIITPVFVLKVAYVCSPDFRF